MTTQKWKQLTSLCGLGLCVAISVVSGCRSTSSRRLSTELTVNTFITLVSADRVGEAEAMLVKRAKEMYDTKDLERYFGNDVAPAGRSAAIYADDSNALVITSPVRIEGQIGVWQFYLLYATDQWRIADLGAEEIHTPDERDEIVGDVKSFLNEHPEAVAIRGPEYLARTSNKDSLEDLLRQYCEHFEK
jgi:hypothetical protein